MRKKFTMLLTALLCCMGVAKAEVTDLPQMSNEGDIKWYTIRNTRSTSGRYLYWTETGLKDANKITRSSLFYFTGTAEECYIHNAVTDLLFTGAGAWNADGVKCKISVTPYGDKNTGLAIEFSGTALNENNTGNTYTTWGANDEGSVFVIETADVASLVDNYKTEVINALEYWAKLPVVFNGELVGAAKSTIEKISSTDYAVFAVIDENLENAVGNVAEKKLTFQTTATDSGRDGVWIAANANTMLAFGAAKDAQDYNAIWSLQHAGGSQFYLYNELNKVYLGAPVNNQTAIALTSAPAAAYTLEATNENVVEMHCNGGTIHASNHNDDKLISWDGDENASRWMVNIVDVTKDIKDLLATIEQGDYADAPKLGQYPTDAYEALVEASNTAKTVEEVEAAIDNFKKAKNLPVFTITGVKDYVVGKSIYDGSNENGSLNFTTTNPYDKTMWWALDITETAVSVAENIGIYNVGTGRGFWGTSSIKIGETVENIADDDIFLFYTTGNSTPIHFQERDFAIVRWSSTEANSGSAAKFIYVGNTYDLKNLNDGHITALAALQTAYDANVKYANVVFGDALGQYKGDEESLVDAFESAESILNATIGEQVAESVDDIKAVTSAISEAISKLSLNMPVTDRYYRIKGTNGGNSYYITGNTTTTSNDERIALTEQAGESTIYYLTDDYKLKACQSGKYIGLSNSAWTFADTQEAASTIEFAASPRTTGVYTIKSADRYLHCSVENGTAYINRCESNNCLEHDWVIELMPGNVVLPEGVNAANYEEMFGENTVTDGENYYKTLKEALNGIHQQGKEALYCKPGANLGTMTHGHVCASLTIYGNGAAMDASGEQDFELDTYTGINGQGGSDVAGDLTLTVKNLNGCGAWGQRNSAHTLNIVFENCKDMNRVYISGTSGTNNITLTNCSFLGSVDNKCTLYSNANGEISLTDVVFKDIYAPVNLNHKIAGVQTISISGCTFTACGTAEYDYAAPVRVLSSVEGAQSELTIANCTFVDTKANKLGQNADILLDYGVGESALAISNTAATVTVEAKDNKGVVTVVTTEDAMSFTNALPTLSGAGSEESPYLINNINDLVLFRESVNEGETKYNASGVYVALGEDIDLAGENWVGIGTETNNFKGIFDGGDKTISNLEIVETEAKESKAYIGLFGYAKDVTIKNLIIENVNIDIPCLDIDHSQGHIGAVAGSLEGTSTIENVTVKGDITVYATQDANGASRVAVIAGGNSYGNVTMKNVHVNANEGSYLKANNNTGALAGQLQGKMVFENCSSNIDVTVNKFFAGGLVGIAAGDSKFTNCHTTGNVAVVAGREGRANDHYRVGGIAGGWADGKTKVCTLENCSYEGELSGTNADGSVAETLDYDGYVGRGYTLSNCAGSKVVIGDKEFVQAYDDKYGFYVVNGVYEIGTLASLKIFRDKVNAGEDYYEGKTVKLTANIDLAGENWVGIGSAYMDHGFMGNFDGQTYKIKNLTITDPVLDSDGYAYAGLFSVTEGIDKDNQNTIQNLTIENVTINTTGHIVSAAIAYPYYTIVKNVTVCGDIEIKGGDYTAGALAYTRRCVEASDLTVVGNEGSFVEGKITVGGVISDIQMNGGLKANYSNFSAEGLTVAGEKSVGGISGIISLQTLDGASVKNVTLNCDNMSVGVVAGSWGDVSTISNVVTENVEGATAIIGATYKNGAPVEAKIGDTYYATIEDAMKVEGDDVVDALVPITLADNEDYVYSKNCNVEELSYSRTFANHGVWNAMFLPFEIPMSMLKDNYRVAYINDIHSSDKNGDGEVQVEEMWMEVIEITNEEAVLHANHPYVIWAKTEEAKEFNITLENTTLYAVNENASFDCSSMYHTFTITGTYNKRTSEELANSLVVSTEGGWVTSTTGMNPFRLCMEVAKRDGTPVKFEVSKAKAIRICTRGEEANTTGIDNVELNEQNTIYDLMGRRVMTPQKGGIYIVNGKKIIF